MAPIEGALAEDDYYSIAPSTAVNSQTLVL